MSIVATEADAVYVPSPEAEGHALQMRALLNADLWEEDKTRAIAEYHATLTQEMQLEVWPLLSASERRAWKEYERMGRQ